jgi:membrane fusion protein
MQKQHQFVSPIYLQQKLDDVKDQEIKVQTLNRQRASLDGSLAQARADLPAVQTRTRSQLDQVDQRVSSVRQDIAEADLRRGPMKREIVVVAPIDGTVTNIGPARGQTVAADTQLATVLPKDSPLHAELLVPTRAIGFVHPGQPVTLRYEAFPYERFGQFHGAVESVGKTVWTQGDSVGPLAVREPVYRIIVNVDRQSIDSGSDSFPLRAGMVASADLLMEKRTLIEWLFQPVLQLRERMRSNVPEHA